MNYSPILICLCRTSISPSEKSIVASHFDLFWFVYYWNTYDMGVFILSQKWFTNVRSIINQFFGLFRDKLAYISINIDRKCVPFYLFSLCFNIFSTMNVYTLNFFFFALSAFWMISAVYIRNTRLDLQSRIKVRSFRLSVFSKVTDFGW